MGLVLGPVFNSWGLMAYGESPTCGCEGRSELLSSGQVGLVLLPEGGDAMSTHVAQSPGL